MCLDHLLDPVLRANIAPYVSDDDPCGLCGAPVAADLEQVVDEFQAAVARRFKPASESYDSWEDVEERGWLSLDDVFAGELGVRDAVDDALYGLVLYEIEDEGWVPDPEHELTLGEQHRAGWAELQRVLTSQSRFFALDVTDDDHRFEMIVGTSPRVLLNRLAEMIERYGLYHAVQPGELLWRGRKDGRPQHKWGPSELAAAPSRMSKQSRMSPAGISMFYGADTVDTVVAELGASPREWVMSGAFTPVRTLRLLDLTRLPQMPSPFDDAGQDRSEELTFLARFNAEVSRPIVPDDRVHVEYVPTQFVTEFLRVHFSTAADAALDGIAFRSSRCDGVSFVVFADHDQCLRSVDEVVEMSPREAGGVPREFRIRQDVRPQILEWSGQPLDVRRV